MVSAVATPIYFIALFVVYGVMRLWTEVPSTIFANVVAGVPAYFLYRNWVWGRSGRSHFMGEVVPFWVVSIIGAIVTVIFAAEARQLGVRHHLGHELRTGLLLAATVAAFGSLWVGKYFVFHRLFHREEASTPTLVEVDVA